MSTRDIKNGDKINALIRQFKNTDNYIVLSNYFDVIIVIDLVSVSRHINFRGLFKAKANKLDCNVA